MLVKILNDELSNQIKELFQAQLTYPVELLHFFSKDECDSCDETMRLLEEIASLSDKLHISNYDIEANLPLTQKYNIQHTPGLVVTGGGPQGLIDYGIRFTGIPSGYEFGSLIQAIILVSKRDSGLKPATRSQLRELNKPVQLQVFVTPT